MNKKFWDEVADDAKQIIDLYNDLVNKKSKEVLKDFLEHCFNTELITEKMFHNLYKEAEEW